MKKKKILIIAGVALVVLSLGVFLALTFCTCVVPDCIAFKQSGSDHCARHTCHLDSCTNYKQSDDPYCGVHNCAYDDCGELAAEFEGSYNYCSEHQCQVEGCTQGIESQGHCFHHICSDPYCDTPINEVNSFCDEHKR